MKIGALIHMYPPAHNAGAEHMLHAMFSYFVEQGHDCVIVVEGPEKQKYGSEPYVLDGVRVSEDRRTLNHIDVLFTHLDRTPEAEEIAQKRGIPLVQVFHNESRPPMATKCDLAVYNSHWLLQDAPLDCPSVVVHPPVWPECYLVEPKGNYITLINLQRAKGVEMFYRLAHDMPQHQFLGVKGSYGIQEKAPDLPNLTILENQPDIRGVYERTKILLMPSSYESYGRCAIEAAVSGIPTIAHPTRGLREALGEAGTYPVPDNPSWQAAVNFVLDTYGARSMLAKAHAKSLDPTAEMAACLDALTTVVAKNAS